MGFIIMWVALGLTLAIVIGVFLWNNLRTPKYTSIGDYLRKEGIPPRPKGFMK